MRRHLLIAWLCMLHGSVPANAQGPQDAETRAGRIAEQQREKSTELKPYEPNKAEIWVKKLEEQLFGGALHWHPFFQSAYRGGGFTLGAGYTGRVADYNTIDVRASFTPAGYIRTEAEFRAPRLLDRRGTLSVIGGWRQATQVGFYGFGTANTSKDDQTRYSFTQPYVSAALELRPTRRWLTFVGGAEYSHWNPGPADSSFPSIEEVYTPDEVPGLLAEPRYVQLFGTLAADWRTSPGYTRRGGYYAVTTNFFLDGADQYSFRRMDYDAIQHVPLGRDAWVLSLRGRIETTYTGDNEVVPYFMMPSLGGGSDLRGFSSWRFRDLNSLLLQAEWRVLVNAFFDTALFFDAGKVTTRRADLDLHGLKNDYGIGIRFHGPAATPLRIDIAKGNEGYHLVFSANAVF
jgi:hypothetical protein